MSRAGRRGGLPVTPLQGLQAGRTNGRCAVENVMSAREEVRRFLVRLGARTTATLVAAVLVTGGATSALDVVPDDGSVISVDSTHSHGYSLTSTVRACP